MSAHVVATSEKDTCTSLKELSLGLWSHAPDPTPVPFLTESSNRSGGVQTACPSASKEEQRQLSFQRDGRVPAECLSQGCTGSAHEGWRSTWLLGRCSDRYTLTCCEGKFSLPPGAYQGLPVTLYFYLLIFHWGSNNIFEQQLLRLSRSM